MKDTSFVGDNIHLQSSKVKRGGSFCNKMNHARSFYNLQEKKKKKIERER